jgi:hypothetical protein
MTALQQFCKTMFCEEETSDHQRSILLVDIMNTMGFSKPKRQIKIYDKYLQEEIANIFRPTSNTMLTITGSTSEGLCDGIYSNRLITILICYSQLEISSYALHVEAILTILHSYMTMKIMIHLFLSKKVKNFQDMSSYRWRKRKPIVFMLTVVK